MKISIVTPSFNQCVFLERTIESVLNQKYCDLEYVIVDGGSSDGSVDIIRRNSVNLKWWVAERDNGQYAALNKGFAHTTGEIMGWINSDDIYLPKCLHVVAEIFNRFPEVQWITTLFPTHCDVHGNIVSASLLPGFNKQLFASGANVPGLSSVSKGFIQQESTFWRRSLWDATGGYLDENYSVAADFELWDRFMEVCELYGVLAPLASFRVHGPQRSRRLLERYYAEAKAILERRGVHPSNNSRARWGGRAAKFLPSRYHEALGLCKPCWNVGWSLDRGWHIKRDVVSVY